MSSLQRRIVSPFCTSLRDQSNNYSSPPTMAVESQRSQVHSVAEKSSNVEVEDACTDSEKGGGQPRQGDYAGAVAKSDPAEIALVKKMDWRIMPTLWTMYFL